MSRRSRWWIAGAGLAAVAAAAVSVVAWPDDPLTEEECRDLVGELLTGGTEFPAECQEWLDSSVDQIEQEAAVIGDCQDAVAEAHAERWTPELEFTSADTEDTPNGDVRVTGSATSVNQLGEAQEWTYECTVSVDGGAIDVLQAGTDSA